jgi:acetylcholinesterase
LPVLVFTPGGGFIQGASSIYDMRPLIERSMRMHQPFIGVVINYRLGPLGFLNVGDIFNQGLLDQFAALRWVHNNIAAFGGDAHRLVVMGQSAGAESVIHQLLNATVPIRGAWMMSVPSASPPFLLSAPADNYVVPSYAAACGCTTDIVNCLRTVNTSTLVAQSDAWQGSGVGFGGVIRENVFRQLQHPIQTPVVLSTCRDEGTSEAIGFNASSDATTDIAIESLAYGIHDTNFQPAMLQAYPNDPAVGCPYDGRNTTYGQPSQFKRMSAIFTDGTYAEPWTEYLQLFPRAWGVLFEQPLTNNPAYGVQHGSDVPYYFPSISNHTFSPQLTTTMQSALIRFVTDLKPGWPPYAATQRVVSIKEGETQEIKPPDRPGFAVIKRYLRPKLDRY